MLEKFYRVSFEKQQIPWRIPLSWGGDNNDEPGWGQWYMTNTSSWYVLYALSGIYYNGLTNELSLNPHPIEKNGGSFSVPVFLPRFHGRVTQDANKLSLKVDTLFGGDSLAVSRIIGSTQDAFSAVLIDGKDIVSEKSGADFDVKGELRAGGTLELIRNSD